MNASTIQHRWSGNRGKRRPVSAASVHVRQAMARMAAATLYEELFPKGTKLSQYGIASQKLSDGREETRGGAVGDVAALMLARPDTAMEIALHLLGVAESVATGSDACLIAVLCEEQSADGAEDVAQVQLLASPDCVEALRAYIAAADAADAARRVARNVAARKAAEREMVGS